jgi:CheY-like chemotaxis protein
MFLGTLSFHVTTEDAKRLLGRVKETTDVLRDQFDSLLDLSKFDAGVVQPDLSAFDVAALTRTLVEEIRPEAEAKGLTLQTAIADAPVRTDPMLIERVLRNLLTNAVKYTSAGAVTVCIRTQDREVLIEVSDTGPGIPADQQSRIFEEYVQLANPARQRRHGVGLGLAIVKRIDALLDLHLTIESEVGAGSTFRFVVPASSDAILRQSQRPDARVTEFVTTCRVWVLDDDPAILDSFQEQLAAWGAKVEVFSDPESMLGRLRTTAELPRWIFTDDMLGTALSGLETAQILSSSFGFGRVCLVTGNTKPDRLSQLRASGFPVIVKPARAEELIAILALES